MEDVAANYAAAFDGHLPFGNRPALLIVDFVMAYLDPSSPLYAGVESALVSNERLLKLAHELKVPVWFTNVVYDACGSNGGLFYKKIPALKVFNEGSPMGEFPPSLQPAATDMVISKQYASAFFGTGLADMLKERSIDTVVITGLSTSGCVRATALDALQHGFAPFVVREATGDRHDAPHEASLFDLQAKYAEVVSEEMAVELFKSAMRNRT
ncbi:MAG: isochorismatase family protein [Sphingorhabdus sp.]|uniref:isochorismatase family protein n=1 Tax=Sphingorhabdus sp. TaxID=1902408 RepID=UPI0038FD27A5